MTLGEGSSIFDLLASSWGSLDRWHHPTLPVMFDSCQDKLDETTRALGRSQRHIAYQIRI